MLKILLTVIFLPVFCNAQHKDLECIPGYRVEIDTQTNVSYTGTLRKSALLGEEACRGSDGLMSGERWMMDAEEIYRYLPLAYVVDSKEDDSKLSHLVFPLDLFVVEERSVAKNNYSSLRRSIYVVARERGSEKAGELLWLFDYKEDSVLLIIADKVKLQLKGVGCEAGIMPYGGV